MRIDAHSEQLFVQVCMRHSYNVAKLPTREVLGLKTADFRVETLHGSVIAEIEELRANSDDERHMRAIHSGEIRAYGTTIGLRARGAIRRGGKQLRAHCDEQIPLLVVLYDNVRTPEGRVGYPMLFTGPEHIDAAMFGDMTVFSPTKPMTQRRPDRSGGRRTTTEVEKRYISAVGVISDCDDKSLYIYHNPFANHPLPLDIFSDEFCHHMKKPVPTFEHPWKWEIIKKQS